MAFPPGYSQFDGLPTIDPEGVDSAFGLYVQKLSALTPSLLSDDAKFSPSQLVEPRAMSSVGIALANGASGSASRTFRLPVSEDSRIAGIRWFGIKNDNAAAHIAFSVAIEGGNNVAGASLISEDWIEVLGEDGYSYASDRTWAGRALWDEKNPVVIQAGSIAKVELRIIESPCIDIVTFQMHMATIHLR